MPSPYSRKKNKVGKVREYYMCRLCNTKRMKKYRKTDEGMALTRSALKRSMQKHSLKQQARIAVKLAIKRGILVRPNFCSECGKKSITQGHHLDYNEPLVVLWLCTGCHADVHQTIKKGAT